MVDEGYLVFNKTDGVYASPDEFPTKGDADEFIESFRERFTRLQGYYLTADGRRIDPADIDLRIEKSGGQEESGALSVGDRVEHKRFKEKGTVTQVNGDEITVQWDDGGAGIISIVQLEPLETLSRKEHLKSEFTPSKEAEIEKTRRRIGLAGSRNQRTVERIINTLETFDYTMDQLIRIEEILNE